MNEINILRYYDILYYNEGTPTISDEEYDRLKEEARKKFPDDPYFSTVGAPVDGDRVKLPYVLGSLEKIKPDTVDKWFLKKDPKSYMATSKIDGISIYVEYDNGEVFFASTRGNGYEGKDITQKAKVFCPSIKYKGMMSLRGEATLLFDDNKRVGYKNRRNGAAGILNKKESTKYTKLIHPIFYEIIYCDSPSVLGDNEISKLRFLAENGLDVPDFVMVSEPVGQNLEILLRLFKKNALESGYDIDGLVIKPVNYKREDVYYPEYMVAFKMNDVPVEVNVRDVEWTKSRTGKFKPVVFIEPIEIGGVTVSKATGFNAQFIFENGIGKGSRISIVRSGDVIPHIVNVIKRVEPDLPELCPSCREELSWKGVDLVCENPECTGGNEKRIAYFLQKLGAENITETTIKNLGIKSIQECYEIDEFDISNKDGFGINRGEQFVNEVAKTLRARPEKLIAALGMDGIGETIGKLIVDKYKDKHTNAEIFSILSLLTAGELEDIEGIGPITARRFVNEIPKYKDLILFLFDQGLQIEEDVISSISGKIFTLTGKGLLPRNTYISMISGKGGLVKSISKKTDYLVTADKDSQSTKAKKARQYGIPVMSYEDLMVMLNA